ncbi:Mov34/MPN/PAD-1 family protein [Bacillaceae bacterium S4-13-58]
MKPILHIPQSIWSKTQTGLASRGAGKRESACIWVGHREKHRWIVKGIIFLDDIPGTIANKRFHHTPNVVIQQIYELLRKEGFQIIADVHTHPALNVEMSELDKSHPTEFRIGFLSLILPNYGYPPITLKNIGFHEYLGNDKWTRVRYSNIIKRVKFTEDD